MRFHFSYKKVIVIIPLLKFFQINSEKEKILTSKKNKISFEFFIEPSKNFQKFRANKKNLQNFIFSLKKFFSTFFINLEKFLIYNFLSKVLIRKMKISDLDKSHIFF